MPTYVYRRDDGTTFELFQRITDEPLTEDPETGRKVERVISGGVGLQFKGTGFYLTDYARAGKSDTGENGKAAESSEGKAAESSEGKAAESSEGKAGQKAESKPEGSQKTETRPESKTKKAPGSNKG